MKQRSRLLFLVLLCLPASIFASAGSVYCMKARVQLKNGETKTGYFHWATDQFYIGRDGNSTFYYLDPSLRLPGSTDASKGIRISETRYHFHRFIISILSDTLRLYPQVEMINPSRDPKNDSTFIPVMLGNPDRIAPANIKDLIVELVFLCVFGSVETKVSTDDAPWLRHAAKETIDNAGGFDICTYQAILFETPNEKTNALIEQLRAISAAGYHDGDSYEKMRSELTRVIDKLKKEKVIVIAYCSC